VELPWGVRVHYLTPSHTPGSMLCDSRLPFWPATLQTLALVASPRLGLRQQEWEYLVKWKGYHPIEASWVNESDMEHA